MWTGRVYNNFPRKVRKVNFYADQTAKAAKIFLVLCVKFKDITILSDIRTGSPQSVLS